MKVNAHTLKCSTYLKSARFHAAPPPSELNHDHPPGVVCCGGPNEPHGIHINWWLMGLLSITPILTPDLLIFWNRNVWEHRSQDVPAVCQKRHALHPQRLNWREGFSVSTHITDNSLSPFQERSNQVSFFLQYMAESIIMEWQDQSTLLKTSDKND